MSYTRPVRGLIGNLTQLNDLPCSITPMVYAETAVPALLKGFFTFVEPDPKEVYHIVRGKTLLCDFKMAIQDAEIVGSPEDSLATRILFRWAEVGDLALWWYFIASIVKETLIEWSSQVVAKSGCAPFSVTCSSSQPFGGTGDATRPESWNGLNWGGDGGPGCVTAPVSSIRVPPGWKGTIMASAQFENLLGQARGCAARTYIVESGRTIDYYDSYYNLKQMEGPAITYADWINPTQETLTMGVKFEGQTIEPGHDLVVTGGHLYTSLSKAL